MPTFRVRPVQTTPRGALGVAFVALFTDMLIYGIAVPVLPEFSAVAAGGDAAAGTLFAAYAAALVGVTPIAGRWVDRSGPRSPLLAGMIGLAMATALFGVAEPFAALLVARLAQGAAAACSWVAGLALVAAVTPLQDRARNLGLVLSAVSVGVLIGPPVGGLLADNLGHHAPFALGAALALLDGLLRLKLVGPVRTARDDPGTIRGVWRVRGAGAVCLITAVGAALPAITEPVLPLRLAGLGYSATQTGLVYGAAVLACAIVTPIAGSLTQRVAIHALCACGVGISALGLAGTGLTTHVAGLTSCMAVLGVGAGLILGAITPAISTLGTKANPPALGAAFAVFNLAYACGLFVGPALSGPGTDILGFRTAMMTLAILCAIATWASCWYLNRAPARGIAPVQVEGERHA